MINEPTPEIYPSLGHLTACHHETTDPAMNSNQQESIYT